MKRDLQPNAGAKETTVSLMASVSGGQQEPRWTVEVDDLGGYQVSMPQPGRRSHFVEVVARDRLLAVEAERDALAAAVSSSGEQGERTIDPYYVNLGRAVAEWDTPEARQIRDEIAALEGEEATP